VFQARDRNAYGSRSSVALENRAEAVDSGEFLSSVSKPVRLNWSAWLTT